MELRECELVRSDHDVLDAGRRPRAAELGDNAIRFSTRPALGGWAFIVEIVDRRGSSAQARALWFRGHPRRGWIREGSVHFGISDSEFLDLSTTVDRALAGFIPQPPPPGPDGDEFIVCTDGPGYVTERVKDGRVTTLTGFCPWRLDYDHPNELIAYAIVSLACGHIREDFPADSRNSGCAQWRTSRQSAVGEL